MVLTMLMASQEFSLLLVEPLGTYTVSSSVNTTALDCVDSDALTLASISNLCIVMCTYVILTECFTTHLEHPGKEIFAHQLQQYSTLI